MVNICQVVFWPRGSRGSGVNQSEADAEFLLAGEDAWDCCPRGQVADFGLVWGTNAPGEILLSASVVNIAAGWQVPLSLVSRVGRHELGTWQLAFMTHDG